MRLDMCAFEEQFVDHLAAVWHRLPAEARGDFIVPSRLRARAAARGVAGSPEINDVRRPILVSSYGDLKKARQLGRTRIAFIEHGAGQSYWGDPRSAGAASYSGGRDRDDISLFLVPNDDAASRWRKTYPHARVAVVGSPKAEQTPHQPSGGAHELVAISFHFPCPIAPEAGTAWPDFRRQLPALASRFRVLGHGHPRAFPMLGLARHYSRASISVFPDFAEVCQRASVYVCDNSSSLFEFASTGRPVVVLNARAYRLSTNHGLRFEPSDGCPIQSGRHFCGASHVGLQVNPDDDLVAAVEEALADAPARVSARNDALALVYQTREDLVDVVLSWLEQRSEAAA